MKNFIYLLGAGCIVTTCLVSIGGCSTDLEEPYSSDLTIENQITRIKRTSPELNDGIPVHENECALYALTSLKSYSYWNTHDISKNDYYENLRKYATNEYGYKNGEMNESIILGVGQHFKLLSGKKSFDNGASAEEFFENPSNKAKIIGIPGHVGTFQNYDSHNKMVMYHDSTGSHLYPVTQVITVFY